MADLFVKVLDPVGKPITSCELQEFQRMLPGLLQRHAILRIELTSKPVEAPFDPSDTPFLGAPVICSSEPTEGKNALRFILDVPIQIRGGRTRQVLLTVVSRPEEASFQKAFRQAIQQRVGLTKAAKENYRDWYSQIVGPMITEYLEDVIAGEDV
jgi:hypothetical protein